MLAEAGQRQMMQERPDLMSPAGDDYQTRSPPKHGGISNIYQMGSNFEPVKLG